MSSELTEFGHCCKQFKEDHAHIKRLHKRTDNAGNFFFVAQNLVRDVHIYFFLLYDF